MKLAWLATRLRWCIYCNILTVIVIPPYLYLAIFEMWCWSGGRGILKKTVSVLQYLYYYDGAQRYEQFLQVGRLYWALILLGLALCLLSTSVSTVFVVLRIRMFCLHPSLYLLMSRVWWDWSLKWLTNHRPSVLWHCWLGHLTRKILSEMTYNVSNGTLNPTTLTLNCYRESFILFTEH